MSFVYQVADHIAHTTPHAAGPWDPGMQHGGAPSSLIAWAVERVPSREPLQVARITVDLLRPVPIAPLEIRTEILREGKKIQVCAVTLLHEGAAVVRASVLRVRRADLVLPDTAVEEPVTLPGPDAGSEADGFGRPSNAFVNGLTLRVVSGAVRKPGPAAIWFRAHRPIVAGEAITPLMRAAIAADFCNGTSSVLDFTQWTFINADLTVSLARMPVGEWILLDAQTWLGASGTGIAFAKLGDERGYFGRAIQSLVIEKRGA
jgi:Thioesterase-like superfamily